LIAFVPLTVQQIRDDLLFSVARDLCKDAANIRSKTAFDELIETAPGEMVKQAIEREKLCLSWAKKRRSIRQKMQLLPDVFDIPLADIEKQLQHLFGKQFFYQMPCHWMAEVERFLKGIEQRLTRMQGQLNRDIEQVVEIEHYWQKYESFKAQLPKHREHEVVLLNELRWMLEEYRISLFSQPIKTSKPVSAKRLLKMMEQIEAAVRVLN